MSWVKFDDKMPSNPKVLEAGILGRTLWENLICWSNEHHTDGLIPKSVISDLSLILATRAQREFSTSVEGEEIVAKLVACGLLLEGQGSCQINDFLEYQPSRASRERKKKRHADSQMRYQQRISDSAPARPVPSQKNTKKSGKPRKTQRPENWQPKMSHAEKCEPYGLSVETLAEEFCNFHDSRGNLFVDWDKAFFTWINNAIKGFGNGGKPLQPVKQREVIRAPGRAAGE